MEPIIKVEGLNKEFKVLTHHEGIKGRIKDLFSRLADEEQKHFDSLGQVLNGKVPSCVER